ncbi:MAG TPA: sulfurtransferase [Chromatiales bacterium]|nr:sulfurtransferase [Chromatiales bacterium]
MIEWSPETLHARLQRADGMPFILDVREPWEYRLAHIPGSVLIPMREVGLRMEELPKDRDIVVVCHHGIRSRIVAAHLHRHGFERVINLAGGLDAWSLRVDPRLPRY